MTNPWMRPALLLLLSPLLSAQTVSNVFVFKGTIYEQTTSSGVTILADPTPHAPGPYYVDVGVAGSNMGSISPAPTFTGPGIGSTALTLATDSTRWDFKAGYAAPGGLATDYINGTYSVTVPGFNGGTAVNLALSGAFPDSSSIPSVVDTGLTWSGGNLIINAGANTTLTFAGFGQYSTTDPTFHYRQRLDIAPPSGSSFGLLAVSAFGDPAFTSYPITSGLLTPGTTYRVVLEYDILSDDRNVAGAEAWAIYSNQTQFFITAIPEPSTYALLAGVAGLTGAFYRRQRMRAKRSTFNEAPECQSSDH